MRALMRRSGSAPCRLYLNLHCGLEVDINRVLDQELTDERFLVGTI